MDGLQEKLHPLAAATQSLSVDVTSLRSTLEHAQSRISVCEEAEPSFDAGAIVAAVNKNTDAKVGGFSDITLTLESDLATLRMAVDSNSERLHRMDMELLIANPKASKRK